MPLGTQKHCVLSASTLLTILHLLILVRKVTLSRGWRTEGQQDRRMLGITNFIFKETHSCKIRAHLQEQLKELKVRISSRCSKVSSYFTQDTAYSLQLQVCLWFSRKYRLFAASNMRINKYIQWINGNTNELIAVLERVIRGKKYIISYGNTLLCLPVTILTRCLRLV